MTARAKTAATQLRHVVIVGGASGIGAATAQMLASRRWQVTIADIDRELGRATAEHVGGTFLHCDVGEEAGLRKTADAAAGITGVDLPVDAGMVPGLSWSLFGGVPPARTAARSRERSH
jgi:NAD(P)-dependent dehydrogenase (short-subunit alcohol dehydrogenase family)